MSGIHLSSGKGNTRKPHGKPWKQEEKHEVNTRENKGNLEISRKHGGKRKYTKGKGKQRRILREKTGKLWQTLKKWKP